MSARLVGCLAGVAALAAVAGCDRGPATAVPAAPERPVVGTHDGAPAVLLAGRVVLTADAAESAASLGIRTSADLPDRQVYLVDAPSGGSACPMRYVVIVVARGRAEPTPAFGTCSSQARMQVRGSVVMVTMPGFSNIGPAGPAAIFTLKGNAMVAADRERGPAPAAKPVSYTPGFRCNGVVAQDAADAMLAAFEKDYPAALVAPAQVEGVAVAPATLERIVADLACLSAQPGGDPFVPEQAAALFASRRHGAAAFAVLERLAQAGDRHAQRFAAQMQAYAAQAVTPSE